MVKVKSDIIFNNWSYIRTCYQWMSHSVKEWIQTHTAVRVKLLKC